MTDTPDSIPSQAGVVVSPAYAGPGEWLPIAQAATRLGVHPRTVDRRAKDGLLDKRLSVSGAAEFYVPLPDAGTDTPSASESLSDTASDTPDTLSLLLVERLGSLVQPHHDLIRDLVERNATLERENGRLAAELAAERERRTLSDKPWWRFWG